MAQTPKAVRKNVKAKAANNKAFNELEKKAPTVTTKSPQKAKDAVRTAAKKEDKTYLRVQKTRTAARKVTMGK